MQPPAIYLASQSPRRAELLTQIGVEFTKLSIDIDETPRPGEDAAQYVQRLAQEKALAGLQQLVAAGLPLRPVLGADTSVVVDRDILGKPLDRAHGLAMLRRLAARSHQVYSAVCVASASAAPSALSVTDVHFRAISEGEIADYWASGEPQGKAGGYAIQGRGAVFVDAIRGSYSGVVGLPLAETWQLLIQSGA